ncbi:hypothetical protein [Paenibacillus sp. IHBB 10380]|uniref:hypothetical protein n=1 Tax=Paenibacillus sp. IHBB 10380 TaxID=1566358 RepID=UPI0005CFDD7B|nr:hypothetical protein [Paenibacillus sp. IHBB 10380]AJS59563.1 hypothetical protein UB51_15045 [Paenibacillus sp. IHBB 10380]
MYWIFKNKGLQVGLLLVFADQMKDVVTYVDLSKNNQSTRYGEFVLIREYVRQFVTDPSASQESIDQAVFMLIYGIEELGQKYVAGGTPVSFKPADHGVNTQGLKEALAFANQITDAAPVLFQVD